MSHRMSPDTLRRDGDVAVAAGLTEQLLALLADPVSAAATLPLTEVDVISDPAIAPFWNEWMNPERGSPRSQLPSLAEDPSLGDVALLHMRGYHELVGPGTLELAGRWARIRSIASSPARGLYRGVYWGAAGARELPGTSSPAGSLDWKPLLAA